MAFDLSQVNAITVPVEGSPARVYDARVEWVGADALQYIDTGYKACGNTVVDMVMRVPGMTLNSTNKNRFLFGPLRQNPCYYAQLHNDGIAYSSNKSALFFNCRQTTMQYTRWYGITGIETMAFYSTWRSYHFSAKSVQVNGISLTPSNETGQLGSVRCANSLRLFGGGNGTGTVQIASVRIKEGGMVVRDFYPVRLGTTGYLYDTVTGRMYGAADGSGSLLYGSDVSISGNVEQIVVHRPSPYDSRVEYLESNACCVSSGIVGDSTIDYEARISMGSTTGAWVCGSRVGNQINDYSCFYSKTDNANYPFRITYGNKRVNVKNDGDPILIRQTGMSSVVTTGANTYTNLLSSGSFSTGNEFYVVGVNANGGNVASTGVKYYSIRMWKSGTLVRDFFPVRKDGVGYLYDEVSGRLFGNHASGSFAYGNDVANNDRIVIWSRREPYVSDSLVAWWDGIWNAGIGVHDCHSTVWKDLTGNGWDAQLNTSNAGRVLFNANHLLMNILEASNYTAARINKGVLTGAYVCIEVVSSSFMQSYEMFNPGSGTNNGNYGFYTTGRVVQFGTSSGSDKWRFVRGGSDSMYLDKPFYAACNLANNVHYGYIDGEPVSRTDSRATTSYIRGDRAAFGGRGASSGFIKDYGGSGRLFAVRLHSRALTDAEIRQNYMVDRERFNLP